MVDVPPVFRLKIIVAVLQIWLIEASTAARNGTLRYSR